MKHKPWFKFDPASWLTDAELRSCSSASRGTLVDLMCLAHRNAEYGVCMSDDSPETCRMVAKLLSLSCRTFVNHLSSLRQMKRICTTYDGKLYVKRMVEDYAYSLQQSGLGKRGGNPTLKAPLKLDSEESDTKTENIYVKSEKKWQPPPVAVSRVISTRIPQGYHEEPAVSPQSQLDSNSDQEIRYGWNAVKDRWNALASSNGLSAITKLTQHRKDKYRSRCATNNGEDGFWEIVEREIPLLGEFARGSGSWKLDFDFVINSESNLTKLAEGKYRSQEPPTAIAKRSGI